MSRTAAAEAGPIARGAAGGASARRVRGGECSVVVDAVGAREWDRMAVRFADMSYDQTAVWSDGNWGARRVSHLIVRQGEEIVGAARVVLISPPLVPVGLAYVKFGPLWRMAGADPDPQRYGLVLDALADEYAGRRRRLLTVLPRPDPRFKAMEEAVLAERGFHARRPMFDPHRYFVDLTQGSEAQMASLGQKWRYNLKKAMKAGIEVGVETGAGAAAEFTAMHRRMVARKKFRNVDPTDLVPAMIEHLPEEVRPHVFLARKDGTALAGAVVGETGEVAIYLFGASRDEALPLNAGYMLQWSIVGWLSARGRARWYDLGGAALDPRLDQFKTGLIGKEGVKLEMSGEHDLWTSRLGQLAGDAIYWARDMRRRAHNRRASPRRA